MTTEPFDPASLRPTADTVLLVSTIGAAKSGLNPARVVPPGEQPVVYPPPGACSVNVEGKNPEGEAHGWMVLTFLAADGSVIERVRVTREPIGYTSP